MNTSAMYNRMLLFAMLLGIAAYTAAAPAPLLALFAIPTAYIGWRLSSRAIVAPGSAGRLPTAAVNLLLIGAVAFAIYRASTHGFEIAHVAELVIFIELIKLGDRRGPRDDAQILHLSIFLAIAAMLTSNALLVGAILALFLPVMVTAVMLFQLHKGRVVAGLVPADASSISRFQRSGGQIAPSFARHFRRTAGVTVVCTLVAALVVFVIMPRGIGENTLGAWGNPQRGNVTGFADRVSLGSRGVISTSPTVVLDLVVREYSEDGTSMPLGGSEAVHYLRGAVLDAYENGVWHTARGEHKRVQRNIDYPPGKIGDFGSPEGPLVEQIITLRSTAGLDVGGARRRGGPSSRLFAMWRPVRLQVQRQSTIAIHHHDAIIERSGEGGPLTYTVWSTTRDPRPIPARGLEFESSGDFRTPASFDSEPIGELTTQILEEQGIDPDPEVRPIAEDSRAARAIQDYLRLNFEYTLDEQYFPPDVHPIEHFLTDLRRGHCEYYASAMAAMCRSVGINARVITGYVAAEFNQASGHYTVRESNAHAWVEAEAGRGRWRRFDPTPTSDLVRIHRPAPTLLGRVRQMLDAVEFAWNTTIVGFDAGRRERLLRTQRVRESNLVQRLDSLTASTSIGRDHSPLRSIANLALVFAVMAIPAASGFVLWRWLSGRRPFFRRRARGRSRAQAAVPEFFRRYLDTIARRGHPKPHWRPPLAHAQAIPEPDLAGPASDITRLYYEARFAGRPLSALELAHAEQLVDRLVKSSGKAGAHRIGG